MNSKPIFNLPPLDTISITSESSTRCSSTDCSTTECCSTKFPSFTTDPTSSVSNDPSCIINTLPTFSNNLENYIKINNLNDIKYIDNKYLIISKKNCIYCDKSKDLLKEKNISYTIMNCDNILNGQNNINIFLEYMCELIGYEYMTFPMIFFDKKFIGGFNQLVKHVN